MKNNTESIQDIKKVSAKLTAENKRYVIAVANALLFSQNEIELPRKPPRQTAGTM